VGHIEWVDFVRVDRIPASGEIVHARDAWAAPAGGGPVAAVQLAKLAGGATLYTALGDDELGHRAFAELEALGLRVEAVFRSSPTRRAVTTIDASGERTITVLGERLPPLSSDPLPWDELAEADAVYLCACDPEAVRLARRAATVVATSRFLPILREAGVRLDAVVGSAADPSEAYEEGDIEPPPRIVVRTDGARGGSFSIDGGPRVPYSPLAVPGPVGDSYGCGDSFAAGLTYALAGERSPVEAVEFAARCGAWVMSGRGPYQGQLRAEDVHAGRG